MSCRRNFAGKCMFEKKVGSQVILCSDENLSQLMGSLFCCKLMVFVVVIYC